jgi:two-component system, NarL family, sensor histidine kinase UhpB
LINGAVFVAAATLLVVSPATVSHHVTGGELAALAIGLVVIVVTNAALLHSTLAPVDRLIQRLDKFDADAPGRACRACATRSQPDSPQASTTC